MLVLSVGEFDKGGVGVVGYDVDCGLCGGFDEVGRL